MIIVDYSSIAFSNVTAMDLPAEEGILRHTILNSLRAIYAKHKEKYGPDMVLACDDRSWRRDFYPEYKWERRQARDDNDEYWSEIFRIVRLIADEVQENLPWHVLQAKGAEADDIVAVITETTQEFGHYDDVLIIGADSDYKQLLRYPNVALYSNNTKKFQKVEDVSGWLFEAIMTGQGGKDGVPNIRMPDDFYVKKQPGDRQSAITKKFLSEAFEHRHDLESYLSKEEYRNYIRNRTLIDFSHIPDDLRGRIMDEWDKREDTDTNKILSYLINNQLSQLMGKMNDFYPPMN